MQKLQNLWKNSMPKLFKPGNLDSFVLSTSKVQTEIGFWKHLWKEFPIFFQNLTVIVRVRKLKFKKKNPSYCTGTFYIQTYFECMSEGIKAEKLEHRGSVTNVDTLSSLRLLYPPSRQLLCCFASIDQGQ